jgi:lysophospholipase L1-like esterase
MSPWPAAGQRLAGQDGKDDRAGRVRGLVAHWPVIPHSVLTRILTGKFVPDCFHPSQAGYRDWSRALLAAITVAETSSTLRSA